MKKLKEYLVNHGIKQNHFAKELGLSESFISEILKGKRAVPKKYWIKIVKYTMNEIKLEDFLEE